MNCFLIHEIENILEILFDRIQTRNESFDKLLIRNYGIKHREIRFKSRISIQKKSKVHL